VFVSIFYQTRQVLLCIFCYILLATTVAVSDCLSVVYLSECS
jgi:hypothetical protein